MKPPLRLVHNNISTEVIESLWDFVEDAEEGELQGFAIGLYYKGRRYFVHAAGECRKDPIFARGLVAELDDLLRDLGK
jgi:hypothetical protein